jgi:hypothetical protein
MRSSWLIFEESGLELKWCMIGRLLESMTDICRSESLHFDRITEKKKL